MYSFNYYNPTRIIFGKDKLDSIDKYVPSNAKVLITYGGGSAKRNGLIDRVTTALGKRTIYEFGGIEPNPRCETLARAAALVREKGIDFMLAVGGGSVIDGTKFIALASCYDGKAEDLLGFGFNGIPREVVSNAVPFGAVLTLPATGSEMNDGAVISFGKGKFPIMNPLTFPKFSILDPTITFTLPPIQVANGIVDAFVHVLEQYLTFPVDAKVQDRFSEGLLLTLIEIGETSVDEPENYDVRANHIWSATLALNGLIGAGVPQDWTSHSLGHELTALFGIDHGQTLAIVLPSVLEIRREQKREKLLQYAERVWDIKEGTKDERIDRAIAKTRSFFESLGIKTRLSEYGVSAEAIPVVVEQLKAHGMTALSETEDLTPDISRKILENAF